MDIISGTGTQISTPVDEYEQSRGNTYVLYTWYVYVLYEFPRDCSYLFAHHWWCPSLVLTKHLTKNKKRTPENCNNFPFWLALYLNSSVTGHILNFILIVTSTDNKHLICTNRRYCYFTNSVTNTHVFVVLQDMKSKYIINYWWLNYGYIVYWMSTCLETKWTWWQCISVVQ